MKLRLDTEKSNYVIMSGDAVVSGVFTIFENAKKELDRRRANSGDDAGLKLVRFAVAGFIVA